jgi:hypothetical protein
MTTIDWRVWTRQYVLPFAILILSVAVTLRIGTAIGHGDIYFFWMIAVAPIIAFLIGFVARPANALVIPVAVVLFWEAVIVLNRGFADAAATLLPVTALIGLPLWLLIWLGKKARARYDVRRDGMEHTPAA